MKDTTGLTLQVLDESSSFEVGSVYSDRKTIYNFKKSDGKYFVIQLNSSNYDLHTRTDNAIQQVLPIATWPPTPEHPDWSRGSGSFGCNGVTSKSCNVSFDVSSCSDTECVNYNIIGVPGTIEFEVTLPDFTKITLKLPQAFTL
jgi:hypothetical protein